jgi:hypothetical protein
MACSAASQATSVPTQESSGASTEGGPLTDLWVILRLVGDAFLMEVTASSTHSLPASREAFRCPNPQAELSENVPECETVCENTRPLPMATR